ncbi:MAG: hypothetical protein HY661_02435 [Betaproteobacteria bacterium]|nr:hypothetical protein [Betaproteobacteria bacterium]
MSAYAAGILRSLRGDLIHAPEKQPPKPASAHSFFERGAGNPRTAFDISG